MSGERSKTALLGAVLAGLALTASGHEAVAEDSPPRPVATMTAVRMHGYGGVENLRVEQLPRPTPGPGQVRVRVRAASVNPYDWKFRDGRLRAFFQPPLPLIPGFDFAGVVDLVGPGATGWKRGDAVYGFVADGAEGAYAEYVIAEPGNLARKPRAMSFVEAAGLPVAALTAWKALFSFGHLQPGDRVLLNGASGGVGLDSIALAKQHGAYVIAVASADNAALMRQYGADVTLDYRTQKVEEAVHPPVDLAIDGVNASTAAASLATVRPGGRLVSLNLNPATVLDCRNPPRECVQVETFRPIGDAFAQVAKLVSAGKLRMTVGRTFPLAEAAAAQELSRRGGTPGKIVLTVE
jgi:NADPH:quinone reductase-like Zn-dependent oxidoreductase